MGPFELVSLSPLSLANPRAGPVQGPHCYAVCEWFPCACTVNLLADMVADVPLLAAVITSCLKRTGAAASVERRRREPARAISPVLLARGSASPLSACTHSASVHPPLSGLACLVLSVALLMFILSSSCSRSNQASLGMPPLASLCCKRSQILMDAALCRRANC
jgi:hypothetical protein